MMNIRLNLNAVWERFWGVVWFFGQPTRDTKKDRLFVAGVFIAIVVLHAIPIVLLLPLATGLGLLAL